LNIEWESDSIDVNGNGIVDYAVVGTLNEKDEYKNILGVMLDDGRMAILEFQGITGWREDFLAVSTAKLRYTDRDSIVIQFTNSTSNYGGSDIHVLSVKTDSDEVKIVEDATILDGGIDSVDYSSYEKTVITGKTTLVYETSKNELIQYVDKLGVNAVVVIGYNNNLQEIQYYYVYWNGEAWEMSDGVSKIDNITAWNYLKDKYFSDCDTEKISYDANGRLKIVISEQRIPFSSDGEDYRCESVVYLDEVNSDNYIFAYYWVYYEDNGEVYTLKLRDRYYVDSCTGEIKDL
jgi:hypothetical protein